MILFLEKSKFQYCKPCVYLKIDYLLVKGLK